MKIAIVGCCHGCLDKIYNSLGKKKVELLLICGDFQSVRNQVDLMSMSVPDKYKKMGDFPDYYIGKKKAPIFTIFIGGNHEASNYLDELKYGGFVAPNIYYMGRSSVIWYKGLRIGGLSGVYWKKDFVQLSSVNVFNFQENKSLIRSIYHYRKDDYFKLLLINKANNMIMASHDWPEGIYNYGNVNKLLSKKPFFKADIKKHDLGSPFNMSLLKKIEPNYWFSAHLHVKFEAEVKWKDGISKINNNKRDLINDNIESTKKICSKKDIDTNEIQIDMSISNSDSEIENDKEKIIVEPIINNSNEIELNLDSSDDEDCNKLSETSYSKVRKTDIKHNLEPINSSQTDTKFLALDKCLPKRSFLEFLDINKSNSKHSSNMETKCCLYLDEEYIASLKVIEKFKHKLDNLSFDELLNPPEEFINELLTTKNFYMKQFGELDEKQYDELFSVPSKSFVKTASPDDKIYKKYENPQTISFINKFLM